MTNNKSLNNLRGRPSRQSIVGTLTLAATLLLCIAILLTGHTNAAVSPSSTVQLQTSNQNQIHFTLKLPAIEVANGVVSAEGLDAQITTIGSPALPYYHTQIALPPLADAVAEVTAIQWEEQAIDSVLPVPSFSAEFDPVQQISIDELPKLYTPDPAIYEVDALYPNVLYELSEPQYARDLRQVGLSIYPVRYNPKQGKLWVAKEVEVTIHFNGARAALGSYSAEASQVLNAAAASNWHAFPQLNAAKTVLPIGRDTYKIEIDEDGIYELSYAELQAAGLDVANSDPNKFEMMYQGEPVAYQFIGDNDTQFESGEAVRFFGWAFDGSRHDEQFVNHNVFWFWANGNPNRIATQTNPTGFQPVSTYVCQTTYDDNLVYNLTNTNLWDTFPNEATSWFWDGFNSYITKTYPITLTHPANTIEPSQVSVEIFTSIKNLHRMNVTLNGVTKTQSWQNALDLNIGLEIPSNQLVNGGGNLLTLYADPIDSRGNNLQQGPYLLENLKVTYPCYFVANNDELTFDYASGTHEFNISGFSEGNASNILVWDITSRLQPRSVTINSADVISSNGNYIYRIGSNKTTDSRYIATTTTQVKNEHAITQYIGKDISDNGAEWIAITHANFMTETDRLATHRTQHSNLSTKVVDILDITNQYGYGLHTPGAIQEYLKYGLDSWATKPAYVVLVGHAAIKPFHLVDKTFVVTDLLHIDRFMGLVPSDHTFSTLIGTDNIPDLAVGRLAVSTETEAKNIVDKIILYENNIDASADYMRDIAFVADNLDAGGDFCAENRGVENNYLPTVFTHTEFCLDSYITNYGTATATSEMHDALWTYLATKSTSILNYRGHGNITSWGVYLVNAEQAATVQNNDKPMVILSADCLDGNFAFTGAMSLSETFLLLPENRGSAGHWSSAGLGYSYEHTILHTNFYKALYQDSTIPHRFGDADVFAKKAYIQNGKGHISEVYAFILQGDPAMEMPDIDIATAPVLTPTSTSTPDPTSTSTPDPTSTSTPDPTSTSTPDPTIVPSGQHIVYLPILTK